MGDFRVPSPNTPVPQKIICESSKFIKKDQMWFLKKMALKELKDSYLMETGHIIVNME